MIINGSLWAVTETSLCLIFSLILALNQINNVYSAVSGGMNQDQKIVCSPVYMHKSSGSKSRQVSEANPLEGFHAVKKFDADGNLVTVLGTKGKGDG